MISRRRLRGTDSLCSTDTCRRWCATELAVRSSPPGSAAPRTHDADSCRHAQACMCAWPLGHEPSVFHTTRLQAHLGVCYERGLGVPADPALARDLFTKGAAAGDRAALCNLGRCLKHGTPARPVGCFVFRGRVCFLRPPVGLWWRFGLGHPVAACRVAYASGAVADPPTPPPPLFCLAFPSPSVRACVRA